jgi:hypothetical protein
MTKPTGREASCINCGRSLSSKKSQQDGICGMCFRDINGGLRR